MLNISKPWFDLLFLISKLTGSGPRSQQFSDQLMHVQKHTDISQNITR